MVRAFLIFILSCVYLISYTCIKLIIILTLRHTISNVFMSMATLQLVQDII